MKLPLLVSVTQLRRKTTDVLRQVAETGRPVFVTQYGSVELVLLTRRTYERLLRAAEREAAPAEQRGVPGAGPASSEAAGAGPSHAGAADRRQERKRAGQTDEGRVGAPIDVAADPLAVFGRLPRGTLFETRWGLVHADTAAFFMEVGEEVKPHLSPERLRAALDEAG